MMHVASEGQGRPVILLHGWACHGGFWAPQVKELAAVCRLFRPDLPGHGQSRAEPAQQSISGIADAVMHLLESRDITDAVLVGWSMGALVAFDLLRRHGRQRVGALVIEDMTPRLLNDADWPHGLRGGFDAAQNRAALGAMRADWVGFTAASLPHLFSRDDRPLPELLAWLEREITSSDPAVMTTLWDSMSRSDYRADLPGFDLPSLVIYGEKSQLYAPDVSAWITGALPRANRVGIPGAGHIPHLEQPELFNSALRAFLAAS